MDDQESLLEPELAPHFHTWQAEPTPKNASALLRAVRPIVDTALRTYAGSSASPTLRGRAQLLALQGLERYDPKRSKLRTHLMSHLQGLRRASAQENQVLSMPERIGLDLHHVHRSANELRDRLSREPSDQELSDHTGLSRKRLAYIRKAQPGYAESSMTNQTDSGGELQADPGVASSDEGKTWHEFVYGGLEPTDQVILEHTLGLHGKPVLPKQELARKLRLSPGAISQRAARIQRQLNQREELGAGL